MKTKLMALSLAILDVLAIAIVTMGQAESESDEFSHDLITISSPSILAGLVCIWFADSLGGYLGPVPGRAGGNADETSPGSAFTSFGWFLLSIPLLLFFFITSFLKTRS